MASNDFINECKTPAYEDRLGKITIDGTEYNQGNKLTSLTLENNIYNNGSIIGSTYTKSLKFSLIDVNKDTQFVGKKALPSVGVKYPNNTTEYIDLDEFTLEELNDEQTKNFTDITGYDALCDIDKPFTYTLGDGTHTVLEYWNNLVESLGLETETTSFTNDSIIIPANPFVNNESNRTVLSEIEKVSCTFAKVEKRTRTVEGVTQTYHVINLVWFDENHEETTTIDGSGTLNNVSRLSDLKLQGNTTQTGTPTPSSPQPINVVSGRQEVNVVGKNLIDISTLQDGYVSSSGTIATTGLTNEEMHSNFIKVEPYTKYTFKIFESSWSGIENNNWLGIGEYSSNNINSFIRRDVLGGTNTSITITTSQNTQYIIVSARGLKSATKIQLEKSLTASEYEEYKGQSYEINLGKNLNFTPYKDGTSKTTNGITFSVDNEGKITANGTATAVAYFYCHTHDATPYLNIEKGIYYLSGGISSNCKLNLRLYNNTTYVANFTDSGNGVVVDTRNYTYNRVFLFVQIENGTQCDNVVFKPMLEKGASATTWSAYKTPIELCKINTYKDMIFRSKGVNLFDGIIRQGDRFTTGLTNTKRLFTTNNIEVKKGTTYTISTTLNTATFRYAINISRIPYPITTSQSSQQFYDSGWKTTGSFTFTPTEDGYLGIIISRINDSDLTSEDISSYVFQLEEGSSVSPYEPYNSKGKWLLHKEIKKAILTGASNEGWTLESDGSFGTRNSYFGDRKFFNNSTTGLLCNNYQVAISGDYYIRWRGANEVNAKIYNKDITTVANFKTWLSAHNTTVYYVLATPTTTEITDEELINQLESIRLLKGTNNIFINSGDLSSKTSLTYYLTNPDYEFTTGDYSTLEGSLTKYGPLNSIMLGRENIGGENVVREDEESIALNGEHKILIDAEYFLFNQTLREQAIEAIYDKLDGFEYYDLTLTTPYGKPFLEVGDKIRVNTNEGNIYDTYILSHEFTYDGTFKSTIKSPALTEQQEIVKSTESISERTRRTEIMVDKANGEITSLTTQTQEIQNDLAQNYYTSTQTNELIQTASTGLTNTFSEAGGNNIFRNTGLWFGATTSKATLLPSNDLYPSEELFMGNEVVYEFWEGVVKRRKEDKASNMIAMVLQNGYLTQEQLIPNGKYTVSFKYNKLIALAVAKVFINDVEYSLNNVGDTEFIQIIEVNSQHINIKFYCSIDDGCEIYDLMVNAGEVKLAYSQNQNETTTDTVNISKGITITSSNLDVKFKADADGIRTLDNNDVEITKFTDTGMKTKEAIIEGKSQIVGTLWQEVGSQTWITRL